VLTFSQRSKPASSERVKTEACCRASTRRTPRCRSQRTLEPAHWTSRPVEPERQRRRVRLDSLTEDRIPRRDQDAAKDAMSASTHQGPSKHTPLTGPTLATTWRRTHSASDRRNWARLRYRVNPLAGADFRPASFASASSPIRRSGRRTVRAQLRRQRPRRTDRAGGERNARIGIGRTVGVGSVSPRKRLGARAPADNKARLYTAGRGLGIP
jgi:hypothetical protein